MRSVIRSYVLNRKVERRYARYVNWNGLVDADPDLCAKDLWMIYVGNSQRASMMPVGGSRLYYFFGAPMPKAQRSNPARFAPNWQTLFKGWPKAVTKPDSSPEPRRDQPARNCRYGPHRKAGSGGEWFCWEILPTPPPLPLGQGGCQAIEDAEVLTRYLVSTNISVADALQRYENARKERTAQLVLKARKRTGLIYGYDPAATEQWYQDLKKRAARSRHQRPGQGNSKWPHGLDCCNSPSSSNVLYSLGPLPQFPASTRHRQTTPHTISLPPV